VGGPVRGDETEILPALLRWFGFVSVRGHHAVQHDAVLGAVNALRPAVRSASTPPSAGPSGIDGACAPHGLWHLRDGRGHLPALCAVSSVTNFLEWPLTMSGRVQKLESGAFRRPACPEVRRQTDA
jgi:hypothetical protein